MTLTITLSEPLATQLQTLAEEQQRSPQELAQHLLTDALAIKQAISPPPLELDEDDSFPTLEEVVAKIKATPPKPGKVRPATGSLADYLRDSPVDPDFDEAAWNKAWAKIEAEMKAITRANDLAEGRPPLKND